MVSLAFLAIQLWAMDIKLEKQEDADPMDDIGVKSQRLSFMYFYIKW